MNFTREDLVVIINVLSKPQHVEMTDMAIRNIAIMNNVKKKAQQVLSEMPLPQPPQKQSPIPVTKKDIKKVKEKIGSKKNGNRQT